MNSNYPLSLHLLREYREISVYKYHLIHSILTDSRFINLSYLFELIPVINKGVSSAFIEPKVRIHGDKGIRPILVRALRDIDDNIEELGVPLFNYTIPVDKIVSKSIQTHLSRYLVEIGRFDDFKILSERCSEFQKEYEQNLNSSCPTNGGRAIYA